MKFTEYLQDVERTWNKQSPERDVKHINLGLLDEIGELASAFKKEIGYNKEIDKVNVLEECGDLLYFVTKYITIIPTDKVSLEGFEDMLDCKVKKPIAMDVYEVYMTLNYQIHSLIYNSSVRDLSFVLYIIKNIEAILQIFDYNLEQCIERNVAKREARFPKGYTQEKAIERDLNNERQILEA